MTGDNMFFLTLVLGKQHIQNVQRGQAKPDWNIENIAFMHNFITSYSHN